MTSCSAGEANRILGKATHIVSNVAPGSLQYARGISTFDEAISTTKSPAIFNISLRPNGLLLSIMAGYKTCYAAIPYDKLRSIVFVPLRDVAMWEHEAEATQAATLCRLPIFAELLEEQSPLLDAVDNVAKQDSLLMITTEHAADTKYVLALVKHNAIHSLVAPWLQRNLSQYYMNCDTFPTTGRLSWSS